MALGYNIFNRSSQEDKELKALLANIIGYNPNNIPLFRAALTHSSSYHGEVDVQHNERLEFLGDAYLGSIVGETLYLKYPKEDEGFLTEMRSKIVSRQNLNQLALDIGLDKLVIYNKADHVLRNSHIFGNALEALVGAIYLDKGYNQTKKFILKQLIAPHVNLNELEHTETNFKKGLYQWAQKLGKDLDFKLVEEERIGNRKLFKIGIFVDNNLWIIGTGWNKKEASQKAASLALEKVNSDNFELTYIEIPAKNI